MKKWIFLLMALAMLALTACGGSSESNPAPEASEPPVVEQTPDRPEPEKNPAAEQEKEEILTLQIMKGEDWLSEWDEQYNDLCTAEWEALALGAEDAQTYPQLAAALEELNRAQDEGAAMFLQEWLPYAKEMDPEYFDGFTNTVKYSIRRADSRILSIREDWDSYTGGAHPNYGTFGINFDTASGKSLELGDVMTDVDAVRSLLVEALREKYPEMLFDDPAELLKDYAPEHFDWTLSYQGITFYFSPYDIAPYAAGLLTITIWFDDHPELFRPEYTAAPSEGWVQTLPDWSTVEFDRRAGDGVRDTLSIRAYESEYGSRQLLITLNEVEYREENWAAFRINPYLVCRDGHWYLYAEGVGENDYRAVYVYDLNGDAPTFLYEFEGRGFLGHWDENVGVYYYDVWNAIAEAAGESE